MTNIPVSPAVPPDPPVPSKWIPDRKVLAGGIFSVLAWALLAGISAATTAMGHPFDLGNFLQPIITGIFTTIGIVPVPSAQGFLASLLGWGAAYLIPPSEWDKIKNLNNRLVAIALKNKDIPVSNSPSAPLPVTPPVSTK